MSAALWTTNKDGLICETRGYLIEKERLLNMRDGLYEWPLHMCSKKWVDIAGFIVAFRNALNTFGFSFDDDAFEATVLECLEKQLRYTLHDIVSECMFPSKEGIMASCWSVDQLFAVGGEVDRILADGFQRAAA